MTEPTASYVDAGSAYVATQFHDMRDVAGCALDEQLEQLQRQYAAASRAAAKAHFEVELLEKCTGTSAGTLAQARRLRAAAETRSARLLRAIDTLGDRLEYA